MDSDLTSLAGIITIVGAAFGAYLSYRRYREDVPLRERRMRYYQDLYKCLGKKLRRYPHFQPVTYSELTELSHCLSNWYHEKGGLLFSQNSRAKYDHIQSKIQKVVYGEKGDKPMPEDNVPGDIIEDIADNEARELRAALAKDVGTRRTTRLKEFLRRLEISFGRISISLEEIFGREEGE